MCLKCCLLLLLIIIYELPVLPFGSHQSPPKWGQPIPVIQWDGEHPTAHQPALRPPQPRHLFLISFASKGFHYEAAISFCMFRYIHLIFDPTVYWRHSALRRFKRKCKSRCWRVFRVQTGSSHHKPHPAGPLFRPEEPAVPRLLYRLHLPITQLHK